MVLLCAMSEMVALGFVLLATRKEGKEAWGSMGGAKVGRAYPSRVDKDNLYPLGFQIDRERLRHHIQCCFRAAVLVAPPPLRLSLMEPINDETKT